MNDDILFNFGDILNHNLYFYSIGNYHTMPSLSVMNRINSKFGSYNIFWNKIKDKMKSSEYTFVVLKDDDLNIISLPNQVIPLL